MSYPISTRQRTAVDNPEYNSTVVHDNSKWINGLVNRCVKATNAQDNFQRSKGYKVYHDDKGKEPYLMTCGERALRNNLAIDHICTII